MCEICLKTPCHSLCPNYEPTVVYHCSNCGGDICAYEDYYDLNGDKWCEACVHDSRREAEPDEAY